ncbi:uncharacterized protein LOC134006553 [Scomber scombrus]|uniref:uncharacterized protein LOC134006553 n=1 Tax=Scomber scombrus TaxID=13677 RepID=UPI002DD9E3B1|nr:uncharacterized protein LOC134006553 [Scomber scombrus]
MGVCELWFILLLLPAYNNSQVTLVKTTGREPYVAQICTNATIDIITSVTCKISTERIRGPECNLTYRIEHGLKHGCDSRFRLMNESQTIFLNLTSLTPEDSGNYSLTDVKTTGRESYVAPICTNEIMNTVLVVVCKISTDKSSGAECRLAYRYGQELFNGCDSRFTLMKKNQTFFLQLTNLTSVDSGNYSCECTKREGTNTLHLNITVEADEEVNSSILPISTSLAVGISCGVTAFIVITGVVLGFILRKIHCRNCSRTDTSALPARETPRSLDKDDPDNLYANLMCPITDVYQTVSSKRHQHGTKTNSARDSDPSDQIYENI